MALKEEIDMGQVYSFDDKYDHQDDLNRMRDKGNGLEYQKHIRHLRRIIDGVENQFAEDLLKSAIQFAQRITVT